MEAKNFRMGGFFGRMPFGFSGEGFREQWSEMSEDEKKTFIEERVNFINEQVSGDDGFFFKKGEISVEDMDKRYEAWKKKSTEEKEAFVKQKNERMEHFFNRKGWGHHRFCH